jgi:hypothetical protein
VLYSLVDVDRYPRARSAFRVVELQGSKGNGLAGVVSSSARRYFTSD